MVTIDRIDISHYFQYARRVASVEYTYKLFHLDQVNSIPAHASVVDVSPKLDDMEELFGFRQSTQPWAAFTEPDDFATQRRSTFAFDRVCPTLGTMEKQLADLQRLQNFIVEKDREGKKQGQGQEEKSEGFSPHDTKAEKKLLCNCLEEVEKLNQLIGFIISRVGQFLQA